MANNPLTNTVADFSCRVCGSGDMPFLFALGANDRYRYFRCGTCDLVNYDLTGGLDQAQYHEVYYDPTDPMLKTNRITDQSVRFLLKHIEKPGSMMDIGCGFGRLVHQMREAGWKVKGLELDASTAARVQDELGIEVQVANFLEAEFDETDRGRYDLVVLRHVLEHLPDSKLAMRKISELLKPDGYLLFEMPNIDGMTMRWSRFLTNRGFHKSRTGDEFVPGHCNEFCRESMKYLAEHTGFRLVDWSTYSKRDALAWFYRTFPVGNKARALLRRDGSTS